MWKCSNPDCGHVQTGGCYCQICMEEVMIAAPERENIPAYGAKVFYRCGIHEMEFRSLGELDERRWLKVALPMCHDEYWGSLHKWETE